MTRIPNKKTRLEMRRGAERVARSQRESVVGRWVNAGRCTFVTRYLVFGPTYVTVQVGDCYFDEPTEVFPSKKMITNIALALDAGMDRKGAREDD